MSQENVAALRRVYEAMARGDFWAAREVFDPEIEWEWSPGATGLTGGRVYRGIEGVEATTRDWFEVWDWFWQEAEEYIDVGDEVVVLARMHGRPKGSQQEIESKGAGVWTFRDGKVIRFKGYDAPADALAAVGLSAASAGVSMGRVSPGVGVWALMGSSLERAAANGHQ